MFTMQGYLESYGRRPARQVCIRPLGRIPTLGRQNLLSTDIGMFDRIAVKGQAQYREESSWY